MPSFVQLKVLERSKVLILKHLCCTLAEQKTVFVQLEHRAEELLCLANQLTSVYSSLSNDELINPRRGEICTSSTVDDGWYI